MGDLINSIWSHVMGYGGGGGGYWENDAVKMLDTLIVYAS